MTAPLAGSNREKPVLLPSQSRPCCATSMFCTELFGKVLSSAASKGMKRWKPWLFKFTRLMPSVNEATHNMPVRSVMTARMWSDCRLCGSLARCA